MNQPLIKLPEAEVAIPQPDLPVGLLRNTGLRRQSISSVLREARERFGQSLPAVSDQLRIKVSHLQAIEDGRFGDLPGNAYAVGFVRTYAEFLGLDPSDMVQRFRAETASQNGARTELVFPTLASEAKFPGGSVLFLSVLLALAVYGGWYYLSDRRGGEVKQVGEVPAELQAPADEAATPADGTATLAERVPAWGAAGPEPTVGEGFPTGATPASPDQAVAAETPPEPVLLSTAGYALVLPAPKPTAIPPLQVAAADPVADSAAVAVVEANPAAQGAPAPAAPAGRIVLVANQESWVQVLNPDGSTLFSQVLRQGEVYPVPDQPGLSLVTGNAGGMEIWVDGRPLPPLGAIGVVRRGIQLDPTQLAAGQPAQ